MNSNGRLITEALHKDVYITGVDEKTVDNKGKPLNPKNPEDSVVFCVNTSLIFGE